MTTRTRGLYEVLITEALAASLASMDKRQVAKTRALRPAEAADRLSLHLSLAFKRFIASLPDDERVEISTAMIKKLIAQLQCTAILGDAAEEMPVDPAEVLSSINDISPTGDVEAIPEPLIPLLDTTLLTNAPGEPRVGRQILTEVHSADRVDVVMAFIRRSGIAPLTEALKGLCDKGRKLRILTTTYTGSTECLALESLRSLGAEVRVSYDTTSTRLHAKAWLFHRASGFSTAYIGSSNLTHSAQISGLEWNVRVSAARNRDVIDKVSAVFESYWNGGDFVPFDPTEFRARTQTENRDSQTLLLSPIELRLEPFQERLLELIAISRRGGHHKNLLVSATGTGKTVMAAVDYARLREVLPRSRLLFVAHRQEILTQSIATFRHCLREQAFGEAWVGRTKPTKFDHVFASIQSLSAAGLEHLEPQHFDVVIVDEFHHAAAPTYRAILEHLRPVELLGLTATPERSDGLSLLEWFDDRIAAELRLWDAIDQQRLCPFVYYGISDGMDLRQVPWRRGRGYDAAELSNLYTSNDVWAKLVLSQLTGRVDSLKLMRCLGFCVSVEHARYMARIFNDADIPAVAVWGDSPDEERRSALTQLATREINAIFSVDLFNEGIDLPSVDTLLMLRPTDSPTLFLQQLGRGLRKSRSKSTCTVLDFVGLHRAEFRFDRKYSALLGGTRRELVDKIETGFAFLPVGCHMELDAVASKEVLANIRNSLPSRWQEKVSELQRVAAANADVSLKGFLRETGLDLTDIYTAGKTWSKLREDAGLSCGSVGPKEDVLRRACSRLLHIDDSLRIESIKALLALPEAPDLREVTTRRRREIRMFVSQLVDKASTKSTTLDEGCLLVWKHPQVRSELLELLEVLQGGIDHLHQPLATHSDVPLQIYARYTRLEILAAFGIGESAKVAPWQTGVYWAEEARTDILAFTLDKTDGQFSPTTRYRDYAITRDLIHWESQGATRAESETGRRYRHHERMGTRVVLFARLRTDDRAFWCLGPATYVSHESERPMAVTWRLHNPLPGDLFASFAAAVA